MVMRIVIPRWFPIPFWLYVWSIGVFIWPFFSGQMMLKLCYCTFCLLVHVCRSCCLGWVHPWHTAVCRRRHPQGRVHGLADVSARSLWPDHGVGAGILAVSVPSIGDHLLVVSAFATYHIYPVLKSGSIALCICFHFIQWVMVPLYMALHFIRLLNILEDWLYVIDTRLYALLCIFSGCVHKLGFSGCVHNQRAIV